MILMMIFHFLQYKPIQEEYFSYQITFDDNLQNERQDREKDMSLLDLMLKKRWNDKKY